MSLPVYGAPVFSAEELCIVNGVFGWNGRFPVVIPWPRSFLCDSARRKHREEIRRVQLAALTGRLMRDRPIGCREEIVGVVYDEQRGTNP